MDNSRNNSRPSIGFYITMLILAVAGIAIYFASLPQ